MSALHYLRCFIGIVIREALRFVHQRERFVAALVRPLVWLVVFAAGFRSVLGVSIIPPYETYVLYEVYIVPGLIGMVQLFNGMQSSLSMVYDREMGSMRTLLVSPLPRWYLLVSKLLAGTAVSVFQVYAFLVIASLFGVDLPLLGFLTVLPVMLVTGLMLGALGLLLSSLIKQLEKQVPPSHTEILTKKLDAAIETENYEAASRYRDRLREIKKTRRKIRKAT